jgi:hypothetical protein
MGLGVGSVDEHPLLEVRINQPRVENLAPLAGG